jgi:hypothetical protein
MELTKAQKTALDQLTTKSAKIRYLNSIEMSRGDIARYLGIRYQHVRNVLITPVKNPRS